MVALLAMTVLSSCGTDREQHGDGEGPLSASAGAGEITMKPVNSGSKFYSFNIGPLCVEEPGAEIALESVSYTAHVEPRDVEFWFRILDEDDVVMKGDDVAAPYYLFAAASGKPPDYRGDTDYAGEHAQDISGRKITQSCRDLAGPERSLGFTTLILAMKVDKKGGYIPGVAIDYTSNGTPYRLLTEWRMVACGTKVTVENCR